MNKDLRDFVKNLFYYLFLVIMLVAFGAFLIAMGLLFAVIGGFPIYGSHLLAIEYGDFCYALGLSSLPLMVGISSAINRRKNARRPFRKA